MAEEKTNQKVAWILGLHHSGTTIFWQAFRKDKRFLCFDEPLTIDLGNWFPRNNDKGTFDEYCHLFRDDPKRFWGLYESISPVQELDSFFTNQQREYLSALLACNSHVVVDETQLHLHLPALSNLTPNSYVVHLYRRASGFATSHLRSNWSWSKKWHRSFVRLLRHEYNKKVFWSRNDFFPGSFRGAVIGKHPQSKFGLMLADAGYDVERIMTAPSLVRLLAYWHYHYHYLEREGPKLFGERFRTLRYEDFALHPDERMAELYQWLGMSAPNDVEYSDVHPSKPPFQVKDDRWLEAAKLAGFSNEELKTLL